MPWPENRPHHFFESSPSLGFSFAPPVEIPLSCIAVMPTCHLCANFVRIKWITIWLGNPPNIGHQLWEVLHKIFHQGHERFLRVHGTVVVENNFCVFQTWYFFHGFAATVHLNSLMVFVTGSKTRTAACASTSSTPFAVAPARVVAPSATHCTYARSCGLLAS